MKAPMKRDLLVVLSLVAAMSARADFNTWFSCPSTADCGETYSVGGDVEETDNDNCTVEISLYKSGFLMAYASASANGNTPVYAATSFQDSGGGNYSATMNGPDSASYSGTTMVADSTPPTAPSNLAATNPATTTIQLSWTASSDNCGIAAYEVMRDSVSLGSAAGTSRTVTGLTPNTSYYFKVRARDGSNNWSDWSQVFAATPTDQSPPSAPPNLAETRTATSVSLTWSASTDDLGVVAYDVYRTHNGANQVGPLAAAGLTFTDRLVWPETPYVYSVKARDAAGNTSAASSVNVTTLQLPNESTATLPANLNSLFGTSGSPANDGSLLLNPHRPSP
jgi:chitodextrinase